MPRERSPATEVRELRRVIRRANDLRANLQEQLSACLKERDHYRREALRLEGEVKTWQERFDMLLKRTPA